MPRPRKHLSPLREELRRLDELRRHGEPPGFPNSLPPRSPDAGKTDGLPLVLKLLLTAVVVVVLIAVGKAFLDWSFNKLDDFIVTDPTARELVKTAVGAADAKSDEQLKAAYRDYLTAHRSFSTLGGGASQPMTFDEFKREHAQRGDNALRELEDANIRRHWSSIRNKRAFYDWCVKNGYLSKQDYADCLRRHNKEYREAPPEKLRSYVRRYARIQ